MKPLMGRAGPLARDGVCLLVGLVELVNRVWVASVFWKAGQSKLAGWDSTLWLFEYEYQVPLLPPALAAGAGTFVELVFPVLLVLGLAGRASASVLYLFNWVAVYSYFETLAGRPIGIMDHLLWGLMLLVPVLRGPGLLSLDAALGLWWRRRAALAASA